MSLFSFVGAMDKVEKTILPTDLREPRITYDRVAMLKLRDMQKSNKSSKMILDVLKSLSIDLLKTNILNTSSSTEMQAK